MSSGGKLSDEDTELLFRPFTRESLAAIEARIAEHAAQKANQGSLKKEDEIGLQGMPEQHSNTHDENLEPDPSLKVDMPLPRKIAANIPPKLIATPIEDLDKYYKNEKVSPFQYIFFLFI